MVNQYKTNTERLLPIVLIVCHVKLWTDVSARSRSTCRLMWFTWQQPINNEVSINKNVNKYLISQTLAIDAIFKQVPALFHYILLLQRCPVWTIWLNYMHVSRLKYKQEDRRHVWWCSNYTDKHILCMSLTMSHETADNIRQTRSWYSGSALQYNITW